MARRDRQAKALIAWVGTRGIKLQPVNWLKALVMLSRSDI
jgi:hypothetical protein